MSYSTDTVRLLILHESQDLAEQLISLLRNSGQTIRAELALDEESLITKIKASSWDLLLARPDVGGLKIEGALKKITELGQDIPVIVIANTLETDKITSYIKSGARHIVTPDANDWLLLVVKQELQNLETRRKLSIAETDLEESEKRVALLLETSQDAVAYVTDGMHIHANEVYSKLFGYEDADDMAGLPIMDLVSPQNHEELKKNLRLQNSDEDVSVNFSFQGIKEDGENFDASMEFSPATFDDEPCTQVVIRFSADSSELEARLQETKLQDPLTGLRNSTFFVDHLDQAAQKALKNSEFSTFFYIHIDNFDDFKAKLGLAGSEKILQVLAAHLEKISPADSEVGRLGDDVFAVWITGHDEEKTNVFAELIISSLEELMPEADGKTVQLTSKIGIASITNTVSNGPTALDNAHKACDNIEKGKNIHIYNPADDLPADGDMEIAQQLKQAFDKNNFFLLYQPVYKLNGTDAVYEGFLRLQSGEKALPPSEFMPSAMTLKLTPKIDRWAILQGIKKVASKRAEGENTRLLVNITGASLVDNSLVGWIEVAIKAAKFPANGLIFQFNESDAITYLKAAQTFVTNVKKLGCETSISRFGCSLEPMKLLAHLDVDYIKLDASFILDLADGERKENTGKLVSEIHKLGKSTIAPNVESATELSNLWQMGVSYIQGYYVQAPAEDMAYDFSEDEE